MLATTQQRERCGDRGPGNPEGPFLRVSYDAYAVFSDLLCYSPGSEKPCSPEADDGAPRAVVYFPAQHLFYILLSVNVCSWLFACTCLSLLLPLLPIAFLFGRTRSFLSPNRSFQGGKRRTIPNVAFGLCISWSPATPHRGTWSE